MKLRYRLFRRSNGIFFVEDRISKKQESLKTRGKIAAQRIFNARERSPSATGDKSANRPRLPHGERPRSRHTDMAARQAWGQLGRVDGGMTSPAVGYSVSHDNAASVVTRGYLRTTHYALRSMNALPTTSPSPKKERICTTTTTVKQILTRCSGFLLTVSSHSLNSYRGCALGNFLCGEGCYVQHNFYLTKGRAWGSFVDVRMNAAEVYCAQYASERAWAQRKYGNFGIFFSSSTEPFQPAERQYGVTRRVLEAMVEFPPDYLIVQTHSHHVTDYLQIYPALAKRTNLRFHISIESDLDRLEGLPPPFSTVEKRINAAGNLHVNGFRVVVTVSPLLPMRDPERFFARLATVADAVVIDHFIEGDGTPGGSRTFRTRLPAAMERVNPDSTRLAYRDFAVSIAQKYFPGRVGIHVDGFAGRFLPAPSVLNLTKAE